MGREDVKYRRQVLILVSDAFSEEIDMDRVQEFECFQT